MNRPILSILLFICTTRLVIAQSYYLTRFRAENGMTSNHVNFTYKSSDGFLWIVTQNGVNRFDGNTIKNFNYVERDSFSIGSNVINDVLETKHHTLIFLHDKGLSLWQKSNNTFKNITGDKFALADDEQLRTIKVYNQNAVILATNFRLLFFDLAKEKVIQSIQLSAESIRFISLLADTSTNVIYIMNDNKLSKYDCVHQSIQYINTLNNYEATYILSMDKHRKLYMSTYNKGIATYDATINETKQTGTPNNAIGYDAVRSISFVNDTILLVATLQHVYHYHVIKNVFTSLLPESISDETFINHTLQDDKNIWVSTSTGLILLKKENITINKINIPELSGSIANVQGNNQNNKIYFSDYTSGKIFEITNTLNKVEINASANEALRYVFTDAFGNEWITTESRCFFKGKKELKWRNIELPLQCLPRNLVNDKEKSVYLRDRNKGILKFNYHTFLFEEFINFPKEDLPLTGMTFSFLTNSLLISSPKKGLFKVNLSNKKSQCIFEQTSASKVSSIDNIVMLNDSVIVLSDIINGITFLNIINNHFINFTTTQGLLSNNNETVVKDLKNNIWTFSSEGVNAIDYDTKEVFSYKGKDLKLIQNICHFQGRIYAATNKNILWWETTKLENSFHKSALYTDYAILGNLHLSWPNGKIFKYDENNITLNFGVLSDASLPKPHVEYRLEGEEKWQDQFSNYSLSFYKLGIGDYKIYIRIKGDENPEQWLVASWRINKPWYLTWWFILCAFSAVGSILYIMVKRRVSELKQKADMKHKINEYKTSALRAQMNPHFIFNSLAGIDNLILDNQVKLASDYLYKFAKLLRSVLDSSKNEVVNFSNDWNTMRLYIELEQLRSNQQFSYFMKADDALIHGHYAIPPLIIQPYLENAIIHGLNKTIDGQLQVTATLKEDILTYIIIDNGRGIDEENKNKLHKSYGMDINKERIQLFNKGKIKDDFTIESTKNHGTKIIIKLLV